MICALSRPSHCHWSLKGTATRVLLCDQTKINGIDTLEELKNKTYPQILKRLANKNLLLCFYCSTFYKHHHRTKKYCSYWKAVWETWSCKYFGTCLTVMWPFWHRLRGTSPNGLPQRPVVIFLLHSLSSASSVFQGLANSLAVLKANSPIKILLAKLCWFGGIFSQLNIVTLAELLMMYYCITRKVSLLV